MDVFAWPRAILLGADWGAQFQVLHRSSSKPLATRNARRCEDCLEQMVVLSCTSRAEGLFHSLTDTPVVESLDLTCTQRLDMFLYFMLMRI